MRLDIGGLTIDWLPVERPARRAPAARCTRSSTSTSRPAAIVAVIRAGKTIHAPPSDFDLEPGDTAVAVGTAEASTLSSSSCRASRRDVTFAALLGAHGVVLHRGRRRPARGARRPGAPRVAQPASRRSPSTSSPASRSASCRAAEVSDDTIDLLSQVAIVLLLFLLGAEYTATEVVGSLRAGVGGGVVDRPSQLPARLRRRAAPRPGLDPDRAICSAASPTSRRRASSPSCSTTSTGSATARRRPSSRSSSSRTWRWRSTCRWRRSARRGGDGRRPLAASPSPSSSSRSPSSSPCATARRSAAASSHSSDEVVLLTVVGLLLVAGGLAEVLGVSGRRRRLPARPVALGRRSPHARRQLLTPLRDLFAAALLRPLRPADRRRRTSLGGARGGRAARAHGAHQDAHGVAGDALELLGQGTPARRHRADRARRVLDRHRRTGVAAGDESLLGALAATYVLIYGARRPAADPLRRRDLALGRPRLAPAPLDAVPRDASVDLGHERLAVDRRTHVARDPAAAPAASRPWG